MPVSETRNIPAYSTDPVVNAIKHCRAAAKCLSAWHDFWLGKTELRPQQGLSYHLDPDDSRLFGSIKRAMAAIIRTNKLVFDVSCIDLLCEELKTLVERLRPVFKKKNLSRHSDEDVEVLNAINDRIGKFSSAYTLCASVNKVVEALSDFIGIADALNTVIRRRESVVDGREPDEIYPRVDLGKYANTFIKFADQNVGLVVYKDQKIGVFYISRAAKNAWKYLRPLLATTSNDGWVVIEGNVRQGFGRTTPDNDSDTTSDVVKLNRYIHSRQRGHTSNHEWKISTEKYIQTEHVE